MIEISADSESQPLENSKPLSQSGGLAWLTLAAIMWGTVGVASGLLNRVEVTPPLMIAFLRLGFSSPFLLGLAWITTRRNPFRLSRREWGYYSGMGLAMAAYQITYFFAIPMSSVTLVVVVALCSSPLIVGLLSTVIFSERLTGPLLSAMGLGIAGTLLLALGGSRGEVFRWDYALGIILALGAGLSYSILTILSKLATRSGAGEARGPIQPIAVAFTLAALVLLPVAIFSGSFKLNLAPGVWALAAYLGLVPTGLAYIIFLKAIARTSATVVTIVTLLEPCIAAGLAWLLLAEQLSLMSIAGAVLLLFSVLLLSLRQT